MFLLAEGMRDAPGVASTVVTGRGGALARRLQATGVAVEAVRWSVSLDPRVLARLLRVVDRATILHAHDSHAHALADVAARLTGARVVVTRRVDMPLRHPARWRRVHGAIALSRAVAGRLIAAGVEPARIHVIPPAVSGSAPGDAWPASVPTPTVDHPLIVCIAALTREKGVDVMIDAMPAVLASHPGARLVVAGDGPERGELAKRVAALGLGDAVTLAGHVADPEAMLDRATVAVQPSRSEGYGSSVLEALSRGVPVVASRTGGLPDALASGGGVLVAREAPGDLAAAVSALLGDAERRRELGGEGRAHAAEHTVPRLVAATLDVYRSV